MSIEEEFKDFKRTSERQQLKRAKTTVLMVGIVSIICLLCMVYGYSQKTEAVRQTDIGVILEKKIVECQDQLEKTEKMAATEAARANEEALVAKILSDQVEKLQLSKKTKK